VTTRARKKPAVGSVSFVGAGPGDPGLLTIRATELLGAAEIVVHDADVPVPVLELAGAQAKLVEVGTGDDGQPLAHAARAKLAIDAAKDGAFVVRLLQGDPAMFGGVGEEAAACSKAKVPFEIVPGVSSVTAVPAYAGLPLTTSKDREVHVIDATAPGVDWSRHTADGVTLVLLHAVDVLGAASAALVAAGRAPATTVAVTRAGTTTEQRTLVSTLERVAADVKAQQFTGPAVVVVGEVVGLREKLSWFETKPLFGGGCWCRGPRNRPVSSRTGCAGTEPSPRRSRPSRSSRRAPPSRWTARCRAWCPGATCGSPSPP
jgi:uroporphyrinogen III methyltransferase/synthase